MLYGKLVEIGSVFEGVDFYKLLFCYLLLNIAKYSIGKRHDHLVEHTCCLIWFRLTK